MNTDIIDLYPTGTDGEQLASKLARYPHIATELYDIARNYEHNRLIDLGSGLAYGAQHFTSAFREYSKSAFQSYVGADIRYHYDSELREQANANVDIVRKALEPMDFTLVDRLPTDLDSQDVVVVCSMLQDFLDGPSQIKECIGTAWDSGIMIHTMRCSDTPPDEQIWVPKLSEFIQMIEDFGHTVTKLRRIGLTDNYLVVSELKTEDETNL